MIGFVKHKCFLINMYRIMETTQVQTFSINILDAHQQQPPDPDGSFVLEIACLQFVLAHVGGSCQAVKEFVVKRSWRTLAVTAFLEMLDGLVLITRRPHQVSTLTR